MTSGRIVVFGEVLFDEFYLNDLSNFVNSVLGGAPMNCAYHLSRNLGLQVQIVSAIGCDELADEVIDTLSREQLDTSLIQRNSYKTGVVPVILSGQDHSFDILKNRAFDYIEATEDVLVAARNAPLIYFGTLAQRSPVSATTLQRILDEAPQAIKFCDINLRKDCETQESVRRSIERADIVKLNDDEVFKILPMVSGSEASFDHSNPREAGRALFEAIKEQWCAKELIVTLGSRGAIAFSKSGDLHYHQGFLVNPGQNADTVGSGDAFAAGFLKNYLSKQPLYSCLELGNRMGALVALERGAICSIDLSKPLLPRELVARGVERAQSIVQAQRPI